MQPVNSRRSRTARPAVPPRPSTRNAVDPHITDNDGITPLWIAVMNSTDVTKTLLDCFPDINVNQTLPNGETALHCAARLGNMAIVKLLLLHGADVGIRSVAGETAADIATDDAVAELLKLLLFVQRK